MQLVHTKEIGLIDCLSTEEGGIPVKELMKRAGEAVASLVEKVRKKGPVTVFCGGGNNGGDGYTAADFLWERGIPVRAVDVFSKGQKSDCGQYFLGKYKDLMGEPLDYIRLTPEEKDKLVEESGCIVDAVYGTGFHGELPETAKELLQRLNKATCPKVAVDIPLGVNGETGEVTAGALHCDFTVSLSFYKRGQLSYPAKEFCGELVLDTLGVPRDANWLPPAHTFGVDRELVKPYFTKRRKNTHKGTYGKTLIVSGCNLYRGAAALATEGAFRMGSGLVALAAEETVLQNTVLRLPETVMVPVSPPEVRENDLEILEAERTSSSVLVGPGCGRYPVVFRLILTLFMEDNGIPLVLDADAINLLSEHQGLLLLKETKRPVVITPHPLEFARLMGKSVGEIQNNRLYYAEEFAKITGKTVVLKGAGTVTAGDMTYINTSGSPALSKAGSGDVLAGAVASLLGQGLPPTLGAALAVYIHGAGGDLLEETYSDRGVLIHDLPGAMAKVIGTLQKE